MINGLKQLKLPPKPEIWQLFAFYLSIANSLAVYSIISEMPALVLRLTEWDVVGAVAYSLVFVLVESVVSVAVVTFCAIVIQSFARMTHFKVLAVSLWPVVYLASLVFISPEPGLVIGLIAFSGLVFLVPRITSLDKLVGLVLDRVSVLGALYLSVDILSLLIVFIRNLPKG